MEKLIVKFHLTTGIILAQGEQCMQWAMTDAVIMMQNMGVCILTGDMSGNSDTIYGCMYINW